MFKRPLLLQTSFAVLLALLLSACGSADAAPTSAPSLAPPTALPALPTQTPVPAAAVVNGEVIPLDEFSAELIRFQEAQAALGNDIPATEAAERVLNDMIDRVLLGQGAVNAGFTLTDAELDARIAALAAEVGGEEALGAWQRSHGYTSETFRIALGKSIAAAWMRDKILAEVPPLAEQVHAQQILLYNRETAEDIQSKLASGVDFGELADAYDPKTGGELGWFPRGYLLEQSIEDLAFSLTIGQPSEIVETEVGFHIVMVLEREAERPLSPDALLALQGKALRNWLAEAREASTIEK